MCISTLQQREFANKLKIDLCSFFDLNESYLTGKSKKQEVVKVRAMFAGVLLSKHTYSYQLIAKFLNRSQHKTICNYIDTFLKNETMIDFHENFKSFKKHYNYEK